MKKTNQAPASFTPKTPEILAQAQSSHPIETLVETITYQGADFEVVKRPDVLWVGCVDYASNNEDESDIDATLNRYRKELIDIPKQDRINPDWDAAISINYSNDNEPNGLMFAQETYSDKQDERYDLLTQPGGLWIRICATKESAQSLLGKDHAGTWEYFAGDDAPLQSAARANGYKQNPNVHIQIEYHCHAEYGTPNPTSYSYIPIVKC